MKKTELILIVIVIVSILLSIVNLPGGVLFTTLSILSLSGLYFYLGLFLFNGIPLKGIFKKSSYKGLSVVRILGTMFLGLVYAALLIGILFKFNYWPGGHFLLLTGINLLILSIIVLFLKTLLSKTVFYKKYLFQSIAFLVVAVAFYFIPFGYIERIKFRNNPEILAVVEALSKDINNQALWDKYFYLSSRNNAQ